MIDEAGSGWLARHWADPLYRNGYLLAASSVISSLLGLAFWVIATDRLAPEAVGIASAAIAALGLLANLASLNLVNGLNRFVPRAGTKTWRLIGGSYVVASTVGVVAGIVFLLGLDFWAGELTFLRSRGMAVWFVVAVAAWVVFVVQDGALTGLRAGSWVTVENLIFAVAKIALLLALLRSSSASGVFLAWTIPVLPIVIGVNILMARRLIPDHVVATERIAEPIDRAMVGRFVAGDYTSSLLWRATTNILPLMVLAMSGPAEAAYFYLAWTVAYVLYLVGRNFGMSMLTETTREPGDAATLTLRTLRQGLTVTVPAAIALAVLAPWVLQLFGREYSDSGAALLRLLALATIPAVVTTTYSSLLRTERRMKALVLLMTGLAVTALSLAWALLDRLGIVGVGVAWLVAHTAAAIAVTVIGLRSTLVEGLDARTLERLGAVRDRLLRAGARRADYSLANAVIAQLDLPDAARWRPQSSLASLTDARGILVGPPEGAPRAILKTASSPQGAASLERARAALISVGSEVSSTLRSSIPSVLAAGVSDGRTYMLESFLAGRPFDERSSDRVRLVRSASRWASDLSATTRQPGHDAVAWLEERSEVVLRSLDAGEPTDLDRAQLMHRELAAALAGRDASRVHGDFWFGNFLVDVDDELVGVVDWDASHPSGPADLDLVTLLLTTRVGSSESETGSVVTELVSAGWSDFEHDLLVSAIDREWASSRAAVLTAWWHSAALNLEKSRRYQPGSPWYVRNFLSVLRRLTN